MNKKILPYLLSLPALIVCIGIILPFLTSIYYSLQRYNLALPYLRGFIWVDNYINLFTSYEFWNTVTVSLIYTVATVGIELLLGLGIALLLRIPTRFNNVAAILLLLPLMTAPAIASLMWKLMTNPGFGILSYLIGLVGLTNFRWASSPSTALFTVILVDVWVYTPFIMVLLIAGLRALPKQPFEAAELDGVPRSFVFFRITLPMLMPYIITASLAFQVSAYLEFFQYTNVGRSAAILMVLWVITYFVSNIFVKNWLKLRERAAGIA